ncbi:MAG: hypothetical protein AAF658_14510, partial [Myxococcota bacterium]
MTYASRIQVAVGVGVLLTSTGCWDGQQTGSTLPADEEVSPSSSADEQMESPSSATLFEPDPRGRTLNRPEEPGTPELSEPTEEPAPPDPVEPPVLDPPDDTAPPEDDLPIACADDEWRNASLEACMPLTVCTLTEREVVPATENSDRECIPSAPWTVFLAERTLEHLFDGEGRSYLRTTGWIRVVSTTGELLDETPVPFGNRIFVRKFIRAADGDYLLGGEGSNLAVIGASCLEHCAGAFVLRLAPTGEVKWITALASAGREDMGALALDSENR